MLRTRIYGLLIALLLCGSPLYAQTVTLSPVQYATLDELESLLTTLDGRVDGLEGLLTTIDADTSGMITSLQLLDDVLTPISPATATATRGVLLGAQYNSSPPTFTNGQQGGLQISAAGRLLADVACSNCSGSGASDVEGSTYTLGTDSVAPAGFYFDDTSPTAATEDRIALARMSARREQYMQIRDAAGNERGVNVNASNQLAIAGPVTNAGTFAVQVDGALLTSSQLIDDIIFTDDAAFTVATSKVAAVGFMLDDTSPDTVNEGDVGIPRMSAARIQYQALADVTGAAFATIRDTGSSDSLNVSIVDGSGNQITSFGGSGGTALADDADFTAGTTSFTPVGGFYQSSVTACTDGDTCAVGITAQRTQKVTLFTAAGAEVTAATDGTVGSAIPTTGPLSVGIYSDFDGSALPTPTNVDTEGEAVPAARSIKGVSYVMLVSEDGSLERGTSTTPMIVGDGSGALNTIVDSGTITTVSTVTSLSQFGGNAINLGSGTIGTGTLRMSIATDDDVSDMATLVEANMVAHDAADAGSPLKIGGKASNAISGLTMVANADRTDFVGGLDGVQIVRPHANLEDRVSAVVGVTDGSSTSLVASQGAGLKFCATTFVVSNSSATNVTVDIRDGTAGSVLMTIPAAANMGGAVIPLQTPICTSDATALAMDPSAAATTVTVTAVGFKTNL